MCRATSVALVTSGNIGPSPVSKVSTSQQRVVTNIFMSSMVIPCLRPLQWGQSMSATRGWFCPLGNRTAQEFSEFGNDGAPWVGVLQLDDHVTNVALQGGRKQPT